MTCVCDIKCVSEYSH